MQIVRDKITVAELKKMVVDVENEIMVVDAGMHADEEVLLLDNGAKQENLWGINLFPHKFDGPGWLVFDSMINLRPSFGNKSRGVDSLEMQEKIKQIVNKLVQQ